MKYDYELNIELVDRSECNVRKLLHSLTCSEKFKGWYISNTIEPDEQEALELSGLAIEGRRLRIYGIAHLPNGKCVTCCLRITIYLDGSIWITICLPLGSLDEIYPIGDYPFGENNNPEIWMREINQWFIEIATAINKLTPFIIAILGFECDYFETKGIFYRSRCCKRIDGVLFPEDKILKWYPPTQYI